MDHFIRLLISLCCLTNLAWCFEDDGTLDIPGDIYTVLFGDLAKVYPSFQLNPSKDIAEMKQLKEQYMENLKRIFEPLDLTAIEKLAKSSGKMLNIRNRKKFTNMNFTMDIDDINQATRRWFWDAIWQGMKTAWNAVVNAAKWVYNGVKTLVYGVMDLFSAMHFNYDKDPYEQYQYEQKKIEQAKYAVAQYLIHSRYRLQTAAKYRAFIRYDKRYQMGYCFCKLRHFLARQRKLMTHAMKNRFTDGWKSYSSGHTVFAIYERMLRVDIDIKDLVYLIRDIDFLEQDYDDIDTNTGASIIKL